MAVSHSETGEEYVKISVYVHLIWRNYRNSEWKRSPNEGDLD